MKPKKRQKLCHNCDGEIDVDVIVCPYCAADLREEKPEQRYESYITHVDASYKGENRYSRNVESVPSLDDAVENQHRLSQEDENKTQFNAFIPTVLFTLGVQLCVLGLLMLLFSHNGVVTLRWDARYWFVYVLASVPFLSFGYRFVKKLG